MRSKLVAIAWCALHMHLQCCHMYTYTHLYLSLVKQQNPYPLPTTKIGTSMCAPQQMLKWYRSEEHCCKESWLFSWLSILSLLSSIPRSLLYHLAVKTTQNNVFFLYMQNTLLHKYSRLSTVALSEVSTILSTLLPFL